MKCTKCNGTGEITVPVEEHLGTVLCGKEQCDECNGTGEIELTNEEWLQTATTEQLADKLTDFSFWLVVELPTNERREKVRNKLLEWLKQPHTQGGAK